MSASAPGDTSRPLVLISHAILAPMQADIEARGWRSVKLWELTDADRAEVRAIAHAGTVALSPEFLTSMPRLGLIANVSAGYEGVDVAWCRARGLEVTHSKGLNADDVADHALGLLIGAWRNILVGDRVVRAITLPQDRPLAMGPGLRGRRLGVVGLGAIGAAVATRAEAFGMQVAWWAPRAKDAAWARAESLPALAADSDILVIACRADATNAGLISREVIDAVGPSGLIVNVARGSLVDEDALIDALRQGRLGGAALDVFVQEPPSAARWADVPNTVLTPHRAGVTSDAFQQMTTQALDNVARFLTGQPVLTPV